MVRGAHGFHTSGERKPHRRDVGGGTPSKSILHFLVRQPAKIARGRVVAEATGRAAWGRGVVTITIANAGSDLQRSSATRLVPRGNRQLLEVVGGEHVNSCTDPEMDERASYVFLAWLNPLVGEPRCAYLQQDGRSGVNEDRSFVTAGQLQFLDRRSSMVHCGSSLLFLHRTNARI